MTQGMHGHMLDPQGRPLFFGLYEGTVVDINDPLKKNRIKLSVTVTGKETTNWARCLLPTTVNSNHPDHQEHTASQIAALLTTTPVSVTDSRGDTETVPALTVVAKAGAATLKHPHKTAVNAVKKWNDSLDVGATEEHTLHRLLPKKGQRVWVMFVAGLVNEPVWIGVQEPK
jgi:Type VI secretion system/phage-baseplate injector OB domain